MFKEILVSVILSILCFQGVYANSEEPEKQLQEAFSAYSKGENATTVAERKTAFNQALSIYTQLEKDYDPSYGNGKLYYNIANSYFQVEEFPAALLYYYRSLKLMPREDKASRNVLITQSKLGIEPSIETQLWKKLFFFHFNFSLPERIQIFFGLACISLVLIIISLMRPFLKLRNLFSMTLIASAAMLLSIGYSRYFDPMNGVIIRSTTMNRDAGTEYAKVSDALILAGSKVQVLEVLKDGQWLKILSPSGQLGYVPNDVIRII